MAATHARQGPKAEKPWRHAIQKASRELVEVQVNGKAKKIRAINAMASKMFKKAIEGDVAAAKECGDRLDGRPAQAVDVGVKVQITAIERTIIAPKAIEAPVIDCESVGVAAVAVKAIDKE